MELKEIIAEIVPALRLLGFKGTNLNYRKETPESVMVVNFQKSSSAERFYVNLGVQPLCVPTECGLNADPKKIKEYDCIFRSRVSPPEDLHGWPNAMNPAMIDTLRGKILNACKQYLYPLAKIPGPITELSIEQFNAQKSDAIFGGNEPKNALNFARIALALGNFERAKAFAQLGLNGCPGSATGLRFMLQNVMKAVKENAIQTGATKTLAKTR